MDLNRGLLAYLYPTGMPTLVYFGALLLVLLFAYLLGSINSAIIISKTLYHEDVRTKGSGNAGTTNMLRNYGNKAALLTLLGDLMKTVVSIFIAGLVFGFYYVGGICINEILYLAGLLSVVGHIFPVYYGFKGGKGVLSTASMALILSPLPFLALLIVFIGVVAMSKYVSLGSVVVAILYPIALRGYFALVFEMEMNGFITLCAVALACIIFWCHRGNLKRIGERTERKISFGKKPKDGEN